MKIFNKSVSLLLTLVMILSLFPTTIFAAPSMSNAGAGSVVITSNPSGGRKYNKKWNGDDVNSMWGYKVSVWYAPIDGDSSTKDTKNYKWGTGYEFQVGKTIYLRRQYLKSRDLKYGLSPDFWNSDSIYTQLKSGYIWSSKKKELKNNNFEYSCTKFITDYNNQQGIPLSTVGQGYINERNDTAKIFALYLDTKPKSSWNYGDLQLEDFLQRLYNMDNPEYVDVSMIDVYTGEYSGVKGRQINSVDDIQVPYPKGFKDKNSTYESPLDISSEEIEYIKSYFLNPSVLNLISYWTRPEGTDYGLWNSTDFVLGAYGFNADTQEYSHKVGQYKLFVEPVMFRNYNGKLGVMSWRDLMLEYQDPLISKSTTMVYKAAVGIPQLSNSIKIATEDKALKFNEIPLKANSMDLTEGNASSIAVDNTSGLGVGIFTSPSLNAWVGDPPNVIKNYVYIKEIKEDGTIVFDKAADSDIEQLTFKKDENNNFTTVPNIDRTCVIEEGQCLLNDMFTTKKVLGVKGSETEWVDVRNPKGFTEEINLDSTEVAGYKFGMFLGEKITFGPEVVASESYQTLLGSNGLSDGLEKGVNAQITQYITEDSQLAAADTVEIEYDHYVKVNGAPLQFAFEKYVLSQAKEFYSYEEANVGMVKEEGVEVVNEETAATIGVPVPANTLVLRYIVIPNPKQYNVVKVINESNGQVYYKTSNSLLDLNETTSTVNITKPPALGLQGASEPRLVDWVTNSEKPAKKINDYVLPSISENGLSGDTLSPITSYPIDDPITHNLFVRWEVRINDIEGPNPVSSNFFVPEWRLSKYWSAYNEVPTAYAQMSLDLNTGCCDSHNLTPTGNWNYKVLNPAPDGSKKFATYLHSETVKKYSASISTSEPEALVGISGNINAIKSTDKSGLRVANWIDSGSISGLQQYNIDSAVKGTSFSSNDFIETPTLYFKTQNTDTYYNGYATYRPRKRGHGHRWKTKTITTSRTDSSVDYIDGELDTVIKFDRYNQVDTNDRLFTTGSVSVKEDGKTTVKYQQDKVLNIYPEYGMLFDNDNNEESIKWVVSDKARQIKPIIYQTLDHKVYVDPVSSGVPVTDSRATRVAQSMGADKNKPIFYKGSPVNTEFRVYRDNNLSKTGMLTVKTFALDIESSVKNSWGNSSYKPIDYHTNLIGALGDIKANVEESLNVSKATNFNSITKGAIKNQKTSSYQKVKYNGSDVTEFTHELYVRGGQVIGVKLTDRNNTSNHTVMSMQDLKNSGDSLYEALINMNLYNESHDKSQTVFSTFEHKAGKTLDEGTYADLLKSTRSKFDDHLLTPDYVGVSVGSGWYSEDSTVLVVKEYVTNYNVPTTVISDKLALGGYPELDAPIDKNLLFSKMGKGYVSLKYYFPLTIGGESTTCYFTYDSLTGHNGSKKCTYLVPNASVTDATRVN